MLLLVGLVAAACGGKSLTLTEYSEQVADLIVGMDARVDAHAEELFSGTPTLDSTRAYLAVRVDEYEGLVDAIDDIDPPEQVVDLHTTLSDVLEKLLVTETARAEFAATLTADDQLNLVWEGAEAQAVDAAEREAIVLCYAAQERIDDTRERSEFDVPWMPAEMKEIVRVTFGCPEG